MWWTGCKRWLDDLLKYRNVGDRIDRTDRLAE